MSDLQCSEKSRLPLKRNLSCSEETHSSHSQSQHLLTSEASYTLMLHTPIHGKMTSRKQRCLRSFSSVFQAHQVWNSRQCHSLADKTRFFMRRSLKKYRKSFPFDACSAKIPFLMGRLRPRKYRDFLVSVTVHAILDT